MVIAIQQRITALHCRAGLLAIGDSSGYVVLVARSWCVCGAWKCWLPRCTQLRLDLGRVTGSWVQLYVLESSPATAAAASAAASPTALGAACSGTQRGIAGDLRRSAITLIAPAAMCSVHDWLSAAETALWVLVHRHRPTIAASASPHWQCTGDPTLGERTDACNWRPRPHNTRVGSAQRQVPRSAAGGARCKLRFFGVLVTGMRVHI